MKNISNIVHNVKRKILIVEDEYINQQILGNIVSEYYDVIYANNGKEAIDILYKNHDHEVSLILLDLNMPVMDGFQFLEVFENTPFSRIPVIVLTADKQAEIESLQLGAQDFILKPYDMPEIILARINRSIMLAEESAMIEKTARDNLTKLFTQKYFFEYIQEFGDLNEKPDMDAIVINVKHLYLVNEIYGYQIGDQVLVSIAKTLKGLFEETQGIASRVGGNEFYLYISHIEDYDKFYNLLIDKIDIDELKDYQLELMVGIYPHCHHNEEETIRRIFDHATKACHLLKEDYHKHINIYDENMYASELKGEMLLHDFEKAIKEKQFKIYLQPKINVKNDEYFLEGAEALVRWISPTQGFVSPGVFIPLLEKNGLICKLDRYIWNEAAAQVRKWKDEFGKSIPISVNVSRIDVLSPNFIEEIEGIVKNNGINVEDLHLEITESAYSSQIKDILEIVETLHNRGFVIEIDDFGTGYSSLSLITTLAFDVMKIDMSFIRNMFKSEKDLRICKNQILLE